MPVSGQALCAECRQEVTRYLADLGNAAPAWTGVSYPLGERCAAELRAEGLIVTIRSVGTTLHDDARR